MKSIIEYLTEDLHRSFQDFSREFIMPVRDGYKTKITTLEQLRKSKIFKAYSDGNDDFAVLDNLYDDYRATEPMTKTMYASAMPHHDPEEYESFDDYTEVWDAHDEDLFVDYIIGYLIDHIRTHRRMIEQEISSNGFLTIYRGMVVGDEYIEHLTTQGKHLGIYWTLDENLADVYGGDPLRHPSPSGDGRLIIITANIHENYINWERTLLARMSNFFGNAEEEITLYKGTPLKIEELYYKDNRDELDITPIKNKTFYA
jgi:hypothetical protein